MDQGRRSEISDWERRVILTGYSDDMPLCTVSVAQIGGDMGTQNADFCVSEIPAYLPSGEGDHVYLWIEKTSRNSQDIAKAIEKVFGVSEIDVGYAGKKDAHAITRQWFSVQTRQNPENAIHQLNELGWMTVLKHSRHTNKLRMGHLRGNQFIVNLYGVRAGDADVQKALDEVQKCGFINYFGKQRFGLDAGNVAHGIRVLTGQKERHQMKKLYISALQSAIFNLSAARRYTEKKFGVEAGDVMQKINAGCFICDDPKTDQLRADNGEIAVTLGLPGKRVMQGSQYTAELEQNALTDVLNVWAEKDNSPGKYDASLINRLADGSRRLFWVRPGNLSFTRLSGDNISIAFELPSGSYATVFLRHLCGSSFTR